MQIATQTLLHLSLIEGVGPATIFKILNYVRKGDLKNPLDFSSVEDFDFEKIYSLNENDFSLFRNLSQKQINVIIEKLSDKSFLEKEINLIKENKISLHSIFDANYPASLKNIFLPPPILYTKGKPIEDKNLKLAIVGSRKAGKYAKNVTDYFAKELVSHGWEIVSGGATGVDTMAHKATLEAGGKTIVVFGCGLLWTYPAENKNLFKEITEKNGTLVSAFPLTMEPNLTTFPARNRIIAGLSNGTLLVQAAEKSGAKITAQFALEQGKTVFAAPGSIFDPLSTGCHQLIAQGAKIAWSVESILEDFGFVIQKPKVNSLEKSKTPIAESKIKLNLSNESNKILQNLTVATSIDELNAKTEIDFATLQNELFSLQLEGIVKQNFAGYWELIK
ncbi:TPA: DNA-protecting protein DprA [Candidatus Dependentiae bacterium]|nr:MAG: protecting protein DprA protein [candidate division TM6 bacterium GW2011_GWE2_31_21]KKP53730.1 MAG: protecting protein DprA protein [candidate division TM6 bacterium GW2011_GWF2_33_332]HBS48516.1 DNA-protecting protein DprA [Candidatus Dependentiae bacterium]HBZ73131.1 DNA-protecting protein DprA [Candidatus Dependentiae bacterium]